MTHKPDRFRVYTELSDGTGFKIPGSNYIFRFDRDGGWYDEDNNYYNAEGDPQTPPYSSRSSSVQDRHDRYSDQQQYDDFYEDIVNQYKYDNHSDDEDPNYNAEELRNMEKIEANLELLSNYPFNKILRVFYRNMDYFLKADDIKKSYQKYVPIVSVVPVIGLDGKTKSEGYFVMQNRQQAKTLVQLEGKNIVGRPVYFSAEKIQELIVDPIDKKWTSGNNNIWKPEVSVEKHKPIAEKKQQSKVGVKQAPKPQLKKQAVKTTENVVLNTNSGSQFIYYSFDLPIFKQSAVFKDWMKGFGLQLDRDYRCLKKRVKKSNQEVFGTLEMTLQAFKKCNNQKFLNREVKFSTEIPESR